MFRAGITMPIRIPAIHFFDYNRTRVQTKEGCVRELHPDSETETEDEAGTPCAAYRVGIHAKGSYRRLTTKQCYEFAQGGSVRLLEEDIPVPDVEIKTDTDGAYVHLCREHTQMYQATRVMYKCSKSRCWRQAVTQRGGVKVCRNHAIRIPSREASPVPVRNDDPLPQITGRNRSNSP